jgi:hypothetical protein
MSDEKRPGKNDIQGVPKYKLYCPGDSRSKAGAFI